MTFDLGPGTGPMTRIGPKFIGRCLFHSGAKLKFDNPFGSIDTKETGALHLGHYAIASNLSQLG